MGWGSGSGLLNNIWFIVRPHIAEDKRVEILAELMNCFADEDCDTLGEVVCGKWSESEPAYAAYRKRILGSSE